MSAVAAIVQERVLAAYLHKMTVLVVATDVFWPVLVEELVAI